MRSVVTMKVSLRTTPMVGTSSCVDQQHTPPLLSRSVLLPVIVFLTWFHTGIIKGWSLC